MTVISMAQQNSGKPNPLFQQVHSRGQILDVCNSNTVVPGITGASVVGYSCSRNATKGGSYFQKIKSDSFHRPKLPLHPVPCDWHLSSHDLTAQRYNVLLIILEWISDTRLYYKNKYNVLKSLKTYFFLILTKKNLPALWAAAVGNIHILDGLSEHKHRDPEETNRSRRYSFEPAHICAGRVCM